MNKYSWDKTGKHMVEDNRRKNVKSKRKWIDRGERLLKKCGPVKMDQNRKKCVCALCSWGLRKEGVSDNKRSPIFCLYNFEENIYAF